MSRSIDGPDTPTVSSLQFDENMSQPIIDEGIVGCRRQFPGQVFAASAASIRTKALSIGHPETKQELVSDLQRTTRRDSNERRGHQSSRPGPRRGPRRAGLFILEYTGRERQTN